MKSEHRSPIGNSSIEIIPSFESLTKAKCKFLIDKEEGVMLKLKII